MALLSSVGWKWGLCSLRQTFPWSEFSTVAQMLLCLAWSLILESSRVDLFFQAPSPPPTGRVTWFATLDIGHPVGAVFQACEAVEWYPHHRHRSTHPSLSLPFGRSSLFLEYDVDSFPLVFSWLPSWGLCKGPWNWPREVRKLSRAVFALFWLLPHAFRGGRNWDLAPLCQNELSREHSALYRVFLLPVQRPGKENKWERQELLEAEGPRTLGVLSTRGKPSLLERIPVRLATWWILSPAGDWVL